MMTDEACLRLIAEIYNTAGCRRDHHQTMRRDRFTGGGVAPSPESSARGNSLTPHIVVEPAREALGFYTAAFGAVIGSVTEIGDTVIHALLDFDGARLTLSDPDVPWGLVAPAGRGLRQYQLNLCVADVDRVVEQAERLGALIVSPAENFISGDRSACIVDPFAVHWNVMTRLSDLYLT